MGRIEAAAAWFFINLGIVLLGVSILVVPPNLFADTGSSCASLCNAQCGSDSTCFSSCTGQCCGTTCNGDNTCMQTCCTSACGTNSTCIQNCDAAAGGVVGGVDCQLGLPYCKGFGTQALCEANPRDCQGSIQQCWCAWFPDAKLYPCQCTIP
jgi:hypothetical protein